MNDTILTLLQSSAIFSSSSGLCSSSDKAKRKSSVVNLKVSLVLLCLPCERNKFINCENCSVVRCSSSCIDGLDRDLQEYDNIDDNP